MSPTLRLPVGLLVSIPTLIRRALNLNTPERHSKSCVSINKLELLVCFTGHSLHVESACSRLEVNQFGCYELMDG